MESRFIAAGLALLGMVALMPVSARAEATSTPGKNTAAASANVWDVNNLGQPIPVQLVKGKRGRLLLVNGVLSAYTPTPGVTIAMNATVNGVHLEPNNYQTDSQVFQEGCNGFCTITGTWWLDLDALEQANPGQFVNVPLDVTLAARAFYGTLTFGKASVTATLVKK
jgi:hypothetical protein